MDEIVSLVQKHASMVWRYRWVALACAFLVTAVGWVVVLSLPEQYSVEAKVFVDTRSLLRPLLHGLAVDSSSGLDTARMVQRTLLVRENLEKVVRETDMDLTTESPEAFERLLDRLRKRISITETRGENIFIVSYKHRDPKTAMRVVEALLNMFVEQSLGKSRIDTRKSRQFLSEQIAQYESKLEAAEQKLKEFKRKNLGLMRDGSDYFTRLEALSTEISSTALQLKEAQSRRDELRQQLEDTSDDLSESQLFQVAETALHPLDARISVLQEKLDELLMKYTEHHPEVLHTQLALNRLMQERQEAIQQALEASSDEDYQPVDNPLYQNMKVALTSADAEVAAIEARQREYQRRQEELQELIDQSLAVEAQFKKLNRDYGIDKRNYEELVKRRETLNITDEASQTSGEFQFKLLEPPREPLFASSPNRSLLNMLVLAVGAGSGMGLAWLLAMLRPTINTKYDLLEITQLPVLGAVSAFLSPAERRARWATHAAFGVGMVALGGFYYIIGTLDGAFVDQLTAHLAGLGLT
jgi:polysaccharide chain length determinant protein (PEP-CTERM system associated)